MQTPSEIFGTVQVKRYAAGSYVDSRYVRGAETVVSIRASVQPASPRDRLHLAEGDRTKDSIAVWTQDVLKSLDEFAMTEADRIVWDGAEWPVKSVEHWHQTPELTHYKAVAVRAQKT